MAPKSHFQCFFPVQNDRLILGHKWCAEGRLLFRANPIDMIRVTVKDNDNATYAMSHLPSQSRTFVFFWSIANNINQIGLLIQTEKHSSSLVWPSWNIPFLLK